MPAPTTATRTSPVSRIAIIAALALGASTVYFALEARAARRAAADRGTGASAGDAVAVAPAAGDRGAAAGASDEVRRLRAENSVLLRRLLDQEAGAGAAARPGPDGGALRTWMDRLEEMRKNDPERYKRMMERREQRRAEAESSLQEQLARLDQRLEALGDSPAGTPEHELLNKIAAVMAELSQLGDKMQALAQLPESERAAQAQPLAQQGRDLYNQLANLRAEDRRNQLQQLGSQLGLNADQTVQMAASVDRIVKDTDPRGMRPRGPGGPPGGRPR